MSEEKEFAAGAASEATGESVFQQDAEVHRVRPTVTDVAVSSGDPIIETDDPRDRGYWEVYPSAFGRPLLAKTLPVGADLETWFDATEYDWPPAARAQVEAVVTSHLQPRVRPRIEDKPPLDELRDEAVAAIIAANRPPRLFRRGGYVMEIKKNERGVPSAQLVEGARMRDRMGEAAYWYKVGKFGPYDVKPTGDLAQILLVTPGLHLPPLDAIVEHPVLGKDGRIRINRGYDERSATFYSPTVPVRGLELDGHPRIAVSWLLEWLEDFEFTSEADRANIIALALTPILRPIIEGQVPMAAVRSTKAGSGKSLLAKSVFMILSGRVPVPYEMTWDDESESGKRLTAIMMDAEPVVFFDNVPEGTTMKSGILAAALTSPTFKGRIIRSSKAPVVQIRCTWVATGNGLTMHTEIARRSYLIELLPTVERPEDRRDFRHPELLNWVKDNRESLLSALLSIVNAWVDDGKRLTKGPQISSFEEWSAVVGSVLRHAGIRGFLENEDRKRDAMEDDSMAQREVLLRTIYEFVEIDRVRDVRGFTKADGEFTLRDLHKSTALNEDMIAATAPFLDRVVWDHPQAVVQIGYALRPIVGGIYGDFVLERRGKSKRGQEYRVVNRSVEGG